MDPVIGSALISGGSSLLGGLFGRSSAKKAAKAQMAFQERMRDTQHQAEVKDLIAAGLNPILSATGGSGAASPAGAMPNVGGDVLGPAVSSALAANLNKAQIKNIEADTDSKVAQAILTNTQQAAINNQNTLFYNTMDEQAQKIRSEAANSAAVANMNTINADSERAIQEAFGMGGQSATRLSEILRTIYQMQSKR